MDVYAVVALSWFGLFFMSLCLWNQKEWEKTRGDQAETTSKR